MVKTQLLCTFAHKSDINIVVEYVQQSYVIPEKRIFVFANADASNNLYCTYNADAGTQRGQNTISIHRKKETNTLYTVNALNEVIRSVNNGILDKTYQLDWTMYQNSFILTDPIGYRVIDLLFFKKISWN
ncbi:hypothetical protein UFOVP1307_202 [uncultured Caudovirales phage]|uniref:Uncharacterized protein n=1 Tax=uncultured Caudovirales phage TaxID=2100421 RepID=A0A6J5N868_9CAUD|nr:hypothetical protein UFOVP651_144 [uncultured Caudovirales phage]CAB4171162.1 hypothetical protein UFOVP902_223 [uncultured Caudovirales phage]CAB4198664.1 hypothetical protein UFOVP1307_202 [uncultured Caudovirales phage]